MKSVTVSTAILALASSCCAFPAAVYEAVASGEVFEEPQLVGRQNQASPQGIGWLPLAPPPFDAKAQYVSNTGDHAFIAPTSSDARGPCPGLNAMANHGYLPRNGIATIQQFIDGTNTVFGMSKDLGGFLAIFGAFIDGDGASWSIGGAPRTGISGSHNNYETDSSPLKADLNQYGSNGRLIMAQFNQLYNMQPNNSSANYNLDVLSNFRRLRFEKSVAENPYFAYLPFTGVEVSQAAFTFIYRFMSNKSATYPEGVLSRDTLKSFMSISGAEGSLTWKFGNEKIPNNWYKRNAADEYSIAYFQADIVRMAAVVPQILTTGCNTGKVNSYQTFDPSILTGGAQNLSSIASNPFCYGCAFAAYSAKNFAGLSDQQFQQYQQAVAPQCGSCPSNINATAIQAMNKACPGFSFYGGPTGPVAPGAIQE